MAQIPTGPIVSGETQGPRFDALARSMSEAAGEEAPKSDGDITNGKLLGGRALTSFGLAITEMSKHKGLPLNRHQRRP